MTLLIKTESPTQCNHFKLNLVKNVKNVELRAALGKSKPARQVAVEEVCAEESAARR